VNPRCEYLMSERPLRWGRERQERLQPIEHLLKQARYARKNAEFPFQPHDRLKAKKAKRGKGKKKNSASTILFDARRRRGEERQSTAAYDPHVARDEERLRVGWKERHPLPRALLLLVLRVHPRPVFAQFRHAPQGLRMVYEGLTESLGQRRISDVFKSRSVSAGNLGGTCSFCVPSCVGPIPPLVITKSYFRTMRLLASMLQHGKDAGPSAHGEKEINIYADFEGRTSHPLHRVSPRLASYNNSGPVSHRFTAGTKACAQCRHIQFNPILEAVAREIVRVTIECLPIQNFVSLPVGGGGPNFSEFAREMSTG
jgi:hypothetical protein